MVQWPWWVLGFALVVDIAIRITAIIVIPRNRRPMSAMAWLLAVFFIPYIGVLLFLLIGNPRLPRARRRKQDQINDLIAETSDQLHFGTLR
ncbi:MAG: PLDc N-terminal domain-containing protein, partial [Microbacteriaceae bacterium]